MDFSFSTDIRHVGDLKVKLDIGRQKRIYFKVRKHSETLWPKETVKQIKGWVLGREKIMLEGGQVDFGLNVGDLNTTSLTKVFTAC